MSRQSAAKPALEQLPIKKKDRRGRPTFAAVRERPARQPAQLVNVLIWRQDVVCPYCGRLGRIRTKESKAADRNRLKCQAPDCGLYFWGWFKDCVLQDVQGI